MSQNPVGGYVIFPATLTRADLIAVTLEAFERTPEEIKAFVYDEYERGYSKRAADVTVLAQEKSGLVEVDPGISIYFEPMVNSYSVVNFSAYWRLVDYDDQPEDADSLVRCWLRTCEQGHALFGYFSNYERMHYPEFLLEEALPEFESGDLADFLWTIGGLSWLVYLGPDLARRWRQVGRPTIQLEETPLISQELSTGAQFVRATLGIF